MTKRPGSWFAGGPMCEKTYSSKALIEKEAVLSTDLTVSS